MVIELGIGIFIGYLLFKDKGKKNASSCIPYESTEDIYKRILNQEKMCIDIINSVEDDKKRQKIDRKSRTINSLNQDKIVCSQQTSAVRNTRKVFNDQWERINAMALVSHNLNCNIFDCSCGEQERVPDKIVGRSYEVLRNK